MRSIVVILIALILGCVKPDPEIIKLRTDISLTTMPSIIQWNDFGKVDNNGIIYWYKEASSRFKDPIIFACHGGYKTVNGKEIWYLFPDPPRRPQPVEEIANSLNNLYPNRQIFLIVCNEKGIPLTVSRVWYAKNRIWVMPTRYLNWWSIFNRMNTKHATGTLDEMIPPPIET